MKFLLVLIYIYISFFSFTYSKKRSVVIGIDGFNPSLLHNSTRNSSINYLISTGSSTMRARTIIQTVSGPGWSSILCALDPTDTGIVDDDWLPPWIYVPTDITPITGNNKEFPCVFEMLKTQNSEVFTAFYYDWSWLENLGNKKIKKNYINDEFFCNGSNITEIIKCDDEILNRAVNLILNSDFDFLFIYLDGLDEIGHTYDWGSDEYEAEIGIMDFYIGRVINALKTKNIYDETYIVITSDHGGSPGVNFHGEQKDSNLFVPWILAGPGIKKNHILKSNVHNMDTAPTLLQGLGFKIHPQWRGRVIDEAFETGFLP